MVTLNLHEIFAVFIHQNTYGSTLYFVVVRALRSAAFGPIIMAVNKVGLRHQK